MLTKTRLILTSLLLSSALVACSDSPATIEAGTSEKDMITKLGEPSFTQSRTLDALTFTHSEWTNEAGTTSVQFHNGEATFSQFSPAPSQD